MGLKRGCPIRCVVFDCKEDCAKHIDAYRSVQSESETFFVIIEITSTQERLPDLAFSAFKQRFEEPTLDEGYTEIIKTKFVPRFRNEDDKLLFQKYLH